MLRLCMAAEVDGLGHGVQYRGPGTRSARSVKLVVVLMQTLPHQSTDRPLVRCNASARMSHPRAAPAVQPVRGGEASHADDVRYTWTLAFCRDLSRRASAHLGQAGGQTNDSMLDR